MGCTGATCTYTAAQPGDFTITAGQGGIQGTAKIQVKPTATSTLLWIVGGVLAALGIGAGAVYYLWGKRKA